MKTLSEVVLALEFKWKFIELDLKLSAWPAPGVDKRVTTPSDIRLQALAKLAVLTPTKWKTPSPSYPNVYLYLFLSA